MCLTPFRRHDQVRYQFADRICLCIAKCRYSGGIERDDDTGFVNDDHAVECSDCDGFGQGLARMQRRQLLG
jgi:hypothetical protein